MSRRRCTIGLRMVHPLLCGFLYRGAKVGSTTRDGYRQVRIVIGGFGLVHQKITCWVISRTKGLFRNCGFIILLIARLPQGVMARVCEHR